MSVPKKPTPRFALFCAVGVVVVLLGTLAPRLATTPAAPASPPSELVPVLTRFAGGSVLVVALCAATVWLLARRWQPRARSAALPQPLTLEAAVPVAGRGCVYLVRAEGQELLVGVDAGGVKAVVPLGPAGDGEWRVESGKWKVEGRRSSAG